MNDHSDIAIEFDHVDYSVNRTRTLIADLNLAIRSWEILILLGKSGSGKTTTLKLINRLLAPARGEVRVQGRSTAQWDPIELRRSIGYAVQEVGLFPHYTVEDNVALIPRVEGWDRSRIAARVKEILALVGLPCEQFAERYPHELSGGQRQRVGLARALAANPPILLMDEPFGALDPLTRAELQREFKLLQKRLGTTVVFVTHDVTEALLLGDRIALMESGRSLGVFSPKEFLRSSNENVKAYVEIFRSGFQLLNG
ncbi:MAG: ATP-binding cassette domain-containing protein [Candidatus Korobacteraceae bacterium]